MGNVCTTREDSPRETTRQYETYTSLWQEVISKLSDDAGFSAECSRVYREECQKLGLEHLTKQQWQEMTTAFINRISCRDQRTCERIYSAVDSLYPGPGERAVSEATFGEFTRLALTLAERDLRERISKLQAKQGSGFVPPPGPPPLSPYVNGSRSSSFQPPINAQVTNSTSSIPPNGVLLPPTAVPAALTSAGWHGSSGSPQLQPPLTEPTPVQFTPSAQRLQEVQRLRAEQEQKTLQQQRLQQELQQLQQQQQQEQQQQQSQLYEQQQELLQQEQRLQDLRAQRHAFEQERAALATADSPVLAMPSATACGASSSSNPFHKGVEDSQFGSVSGIDPAKSMGHMKPPALGGSGSIPQGPPTPVNRQLQPQQQQQSVLAADMVESMKKRILCGHLRVSVFNDHLQLEPKRLALNARTQRLSILRDDGLCEDSWEVDSLRCMTEGIAAAILADPPPSELAMAFRFKFDDGKGSNTPEAMAQDRFLCVVLDSAEVTQLALEAFSQLCGVPIKRAA